MQKVNLFKNMQDNITILIFCELFTDDEKVKALYSKKLGSNMLV